MRRVYLDAHEVGRFGMWCYMLRIDFLLLCLIAGIGVMGLFVLWSASGQDPSMLDRQVLRLGLALVVMLVVARMPPPLLRKYALHLMVLTLLLLVAVLLVGVESKGAKRWLLIPGFGRFQPSEFAKLTVPIAVAAYITKMPTPPSVFRSIGAALIVAVPALLVNLQPDLGTSILVALSGLVVVFMAGVSWWLIVLVVGALVVLTPIYFKYGMKEYQQQRVMTLLNPGSDPLGNDYHIIQSKIAVGSGGVYGRGYLEGTQSQLAFLPERHTDFIFAVIGEELGLMVGLGLLLIYSAVLLRCLVLASSSQDTFARLVAGSYTVTFFIYVFVNIGMVTGILPVVGVPLPLISYGGTSMLALAVAFGFIMSIANDKQVVMRRN